MTISVYSLRALLFIGLIGLLVGCSVAPGYSPGLGLGVDQPEHRNTRLGFGLEAAPNALSTREGGPRLSIVGSFTYERGLSDDISIRSKFIAGQSVSDELPEHAGRFLGLGVGATFRKRLNQVTDLLCVPRLQYVTTGYFGGYGGGLSVLLRRRLQPNLAVYGGPAAYFGRDGASRITRDNGEIFTPGGKALGGHLGLSYDIAKGANLSFEVTPLRQSENYLNRSVWVPAFQLALTGKITGRKAGERRAEWKARRAALRMKRRS